MCIRDRDSYERLLEEGHLQFGSEDIDVESLVLRRESIRCLQRAMQLLTQADMELLQAIYYQGMTERQFAKKKSIHYMTIHNRKVSICLLYTSRYIKRFLIAGIMEGAELKDSDRGTPQGGLISPVLANVYLHYVLDLWFEKAIRPKLRGEAYHVRFADDFLILFQYENEAKDVLEVLKRRLGKFMLEVAEDKTRILPIGRFKGTKDEFDFLGFTFFNAKTRKGKYRLGIRTSKKKLKAKRQAAKAWLRTRMIRPIPETMMRVAAIIRGHCNYYGVNGNLRSLYKIHDYMKQMLSLIHI